MRTRISAAAYSLCLATGLAASSASLAQTTPSPFLSYKTLSGAAARSLVDACLSFAAKNKMLVTIVVLDAHGDVLDMHRMDGSNANAFRTAPLKAKAAFLNHTPTKVLEQRLGQGASAPLWLGDFPQHGGLPIMVDGVVAGAIGVGGGSGTQDEDCGQAAIDSVIGPAAPPK